jgi:hypothetical protein
MALNLNTSPEEFTQWLTARFTSEPPAEVPAVPVTALLARHRKTLLGFRAKGYSMKQISQALQGPPFGVKISVVALQRFLATPKPAKKPVKYTVNIPLKVVPPASALVK